MPRPGSGSRVQLPSFPDAVIDGDQEQLLQALARANRLVRADVRGAGAALLESDGMLHELCRVIERASAGCAASTT